MLFKLLSGHHRDRFEMEVISLMPIGAIGKKIQKIGVPVRSLEVPRGVPAPSALWNLVSYLRQSRPNLVQTWMYHADLLGGLAARMSGCKAVLWNIRNSTLDPATSKRSTILIARLCARLSRRVPTRILCCSEIAKQVHVALGYAANSFQVLPNGFDLSLFKPDATARMSVRDELKLPPDTPLIGLVARFDPQKDHAAFVKAARHLHNAGFHAHFLLCGDGIDAQNSELTGWIKAAELTPCFHLLGRREDIPRLTAGLDIAASSSAYGEAFANVLGEAMACGVVCVATDVGDASMILGDTGRIVPPRDPEALAQGWREMLSLSPEARQQQGAQARCRVEAEFNLPLIVARYEQLYEESDQSCAA